MKRERTLTKRIASLRWYYPGQVLRDSLSSCSQEHPRFSTPIEPQREALENAFLHLCANPESVCLSSAEIDEETEAY